MRILVTGGAGFIGSNFLQSCVGARPENTYLNVDVLSYAANLANLATIADLPNYEFRRIDLVNKQLVSATVSEFCPNLVIHFAAESHVDRSIHAPEAFLMSNVVGTYNLLEAVRELGASADVLFHHVSTDEVYGSLQNDGLFTEESRYDPSSPYSATKAAGDHLVRAYARTYGIRARITNCSNNYGPYQFPEKLIPLTIRNALRRERLPVYGDGTNVRDWLYVGDHCDAIWAVIENGVDGRTYNIGGMNEIRNIDLVKKLCSLVADETGARERELLELIEFVTDRPGHDYRYAIDASRIARECGWKPQENIETGLRKTVRWYLNNSAWVDSVTSGQYRNWIAKNYERRSQSE